MANTPLKRLRVDEDLWDAFGEATEAVGSDRTKVLVAFMKRFVAAMQPPRRTAEWTPLPESPERTTALRP